MADVEKGREAGFRGPATPVTPGEHMVHRVDLGRLRILHAVFPPGYRMGSHYHARACVSVLLEGRFRESFGRREYDCPPGSILAKAPEERHTDRWFGATSRHVVIEPHPERHEEFGPCRPVLESVTHVVDPGALSLGWRVRKELADGDTASELALEALALEILVRIRRGAEERGGGTPPEWLLRVRDYLHEHYAEGVTLEELARIADVHPTHVSRRFSRHFGRGMAAYQRGLRLAAATRDLLESDEEISRIAVRHGFADQAHLGRVLKRERGVTPGQLRRT